ncbi:fatty acid desaturase-domain-containing protein [Xylariales sp. PMI_506]|nr:fatty acid desaturase-domain-containing protein [Xylariales sp. PMI_506]
MNRDRIISRCDVEGMIAEGHTIVIYEDHILRLDAWLEKHPGGRLAILHMVGRDATDEIKVYHSDATLALVKAYRIGRKPNGSWINMKPPIRGGLYQKPEKPIASSSDGSDTNEDEDDEDDITRDDDADDDDSSDFTDQTSITSDCSSVVNDTKAPGLQRRTVRRFDDELAAQDASTTTAVAAAAAAAATPNAELVVAMDPAEYINLLMQDESDQCVRDYPSVDPLVQQDIALKYRQLHQRIRDEGYYECPYLDYGKEMIRYSLLFTGFIVALRYEWYITSAILLGGFWHQIMFTAHDAGHTAITHIFVIDTLIGLFIADFCCGLSMGWWKSSHNVHHLVTNQPEHDPDIQNVPLFATCPSFFKSLSSTYYDGFTFVWDAAADFLVPYQQYTYYPVMGIARFNLYLLSWLHVISNRSTGLNNSRAWWIRPVEIAFMTGYWFLFGYCLLWRTLPTWTIRVVFVLVSHIITMPLHVQITLSHWGMPTSDLGESESFPQRQLRTTMDVDCPAWFDFAHGGLQFQAVHHLFPRVPRHNLRKVQALVREFCKDTGIPYTILTFQKGNKKVLGRLEEIGDQVKMLQKCQSYMAATGESGLH